MQTLRVSLGDRGYPIHIGPGAMAEPSHFAPHVAGKRVAVVTNDVVAPLYLDKVARALRVAGASGVLDVRIEDGEQAKGWATLDRVFDAFLAARLGRDGLVVALGGGVVGDLAGFAAATYQRGVPFIQVPTTLLAQVDSSVGGKTAINHARGKNMIGAFHQPLAVLADVSALNTLPERELKAGLAEVIKHGFILDAGFVAWLEAHMGDLLQRDPGALTYAVRRSCELKAAVVAEDEREGGLRAILNFGHTFGHAIEAGMGYGQWLHGEAVGAGMVMAAELSHRLGGLDRAATDRIRALVAQAGLPVTGASMPIERYLDLMQVDKKAASGKVRFIVLEGLGKAALRGGLDERLVRDSIVAALPGARS